VDKCLDRIREQGARRGAGIGRVQTITMYTALLHTVLRTWPYSSYEEVAYLGRAVFLYDTPHGSGLSASLISYRFSGRRRTAEEKLVSRPCIYWPGYVWHAE
jgi:hypothetical protein